MQSGHAQSTLFHMSAWIDSRHCLWDRALQCLHLIVLISPFGDGCLHMTHTCCCGGVSDEGDGDGVGSVSFVLFALGLRDFVHAGQS